MHADELRDSIQRSPGGTEAGRQDPVGEDPVKVESSSVSEDSDDDSAPANMDSRESFTMEEAPDGGDDTSAEPVTGWRGIDDASVEPPPTRSRAPAATSRGFFSNKSNKENRHPLFYPIIGICVVLSLIITLSLVIPPFVDDDEPSTASAPTEAPSGLAYFDYAQYLRAFDRAIQGKKSKLTDLPSDDPRSEALDWIRNQDTGGTDLPVDLLLERYIMAVIYFAMGGGSEALQNEYGFLGEDTVCDWRSRFFHGVWCNINNRVEKIDLVDVELLGTLPTEIALLEQLQYLQIQGIRERADVPSELGRLSSLKTLMLIDDTLTGRLPTQVGQMSALTHLDLSNNLVSGNSPREIGFLYSLRGLWLHDNRLTGTLPTEYGLLNELTTMDLSQNSFSGNIPTYIGLLSGLSELLLDSNDFGGTFPRALDSLTNLNTLAVQDNPKLTGDLEPFCADDSGISVEADCASSSSVICFCCLCY